MPKNPHRPPGRSFGKIITLLVIISAAAIYFGWNYFSGSLPWQVSPENGGPKVTWLEKEKNRQPETPLPAEEKETGKEAVALRLTPGTDQPDSEPPDECLQTADKILLFFEHLDRQEYIRAYKIKGSSLDHMNGIVNKLLANPPVVVRETDDLFAILNNMAHFYRILGPNDILLVKDILLHERDLIEPTMALFYKWSEIEQDCSEKDMIITLPLSGLYEYAGYFINTLGGQSYLFRRALYLRLLIRYYSTLVIDRANDVDANRYGIDIRYTLDALISEIQSNGDLENREKYLKKLLRLQESYQEKYGSR